MITLDYKNMSKEQLIKLVEILQEYINISEDKVVQSQPKADSLLSTGIDKLIEMGRIRYHTPDDIKKNSMLPDAFGKPFNPYEQNGFPPSNLHWTT